MDEYRLYEYANGVIVLQKRTKPWSNLQLGSDWEDVPTIYEKEEWTNERWKKIMDKEKQEAVEKGYGRGGRN